MRRAMGAVAGGVVLLAAGSLFAVASAADRESESERGKVCSFRNTEGPYGFNCTGFYPRTDAQGSVVGQQPIGVVGVTRGDGRGHFSVEATLSTDFGSLPWKLDGDATLDPKRDCLGRVIYTTNQLTLGDGTVISLPPAVFDFAVAAAGDEILGSATAPGAFGDAVPRLACRLLKVHDRR